SRITFIGPSPSNHNTPAKAWTPRPADCLLCPISVVLGVAAASRTVLASRYQAPDPGRPGARPADGDPVGSRPVSDRCPSRAARPAGPLAAIRGWAFSDNKPARRPAILVALVNRRPGAAGPAPGGILR